MFLRSFVAFLVIASLLTYQSKAFTDESLPGLSTSTTTTVGVPCGAAASYIYLKAIENSPVEFKEVLASPLVSMDMNLTSMVSLMNNHGAATECLKMSPEKAISLRVPMIALIYLDSKVGEKPLGHYIFLNPRSDGSVSIIDSTLDRPVLLNAYSMRNIKWSDFWILPAGTIKTSSDYLQFVLYFGLGAIALGVLQYAIRRSKVSVKLLSILTLLLLQVGCKEITVDAYIS